MALFSSGFVNSLATAKIHENLLNNNYDAYTRHGK
jgi:hypothetical protein